MCVYRRAVLPLVCLMAGASMLAACRPVHAVSFTRFGCLPGHNTSDAWGISADGSVIAGVSGSNSDWDAVRWTRVGGMEAIGHLSGGEGYANASDVSADGSVIVGNSHSSSGSQAMRWTGTGGMMGLGDLSGGDFQSNATGVSADGSVVVGFGTYSGTDTKPVRWTQATGMQPLGLLTGTTRGYAYGISGDGSTIFGCCGSQAFRWTQSGGMVGMGFLGDGTDSYAYSASADGSVIVGYGYSPTTGTEAFRWTQSGGMVRLYDPAGADAMQAAYGVSGDGTKVVGRTHNNHAAIWIQGQGMREITDILAGNGLSATGWTLTRATSISANGNVIVGYGRNPQGQMESWVVDLVPEPSSFLALGSGLLGLMGIARRRK